ncbi:MAG: alpha/beta hydrolase [Opitutus sp.]
MPDFVTDDHVRLNYEVYGEGAYVLFCLHWMGGSAGLWREWCEGLDPKMYRAIALDLRGHGCSTREPCTFTLSRLAQDVIELADCLLVPRFVVAGHSFGGKVAFQLAATEPARVRGLILIGAVGPGCVDLPRETVTHILDHAGDLGFLEDAFRSWFSVGSRAIIHDALVAFSRTPRWALQAVAEIGIYTDATAAIAGIVAPALVISGDSDPVYGHLYQHEAVLRHLPNGQFASVAACGHGLIFERPREIGALARTFLAALP